MNDLDPTLPMAIEDAQAITSSPQVMEIIEKAVDEITTVSEDKKQIENSDKPWLFQPGQSGNPAGRPKKGYSITEAFQEMLGSDPAKKKSIVDKIATAAENGDMTAAKMIWNYMDGMPLQSNDITSMGKEIAGPVVYLPKEDED